MEQYIGLDVSLKDTFIAVREDGQRIWRGKCPSDPEIIAQTLAKRAPNAQRVVFETGPLSVWFYHALSAKGVPAICIDARQPAVPVADLDSWYRCGNSFVFYCSDRGSGQFRQVAFGGCVDRSDHQTLPVGWRRLQLLSRLASFPRADHHVS